MAIAALILLGLILSPAVIGMRGREPGRRIVRWWFGCAAHCLRLRFTEHGQPIGQAALWCANHVSWLDIVVLGATHDLIFVAKSEVRRWPLLGWCAAAAGTLFLRRGADTSSVAAMAGLLRRGRSVAFFPEGTTGIGQRLGRFHSRHFAAAQSSAVPVQPVALRYREAGALSRVAPFVGSDAFLPHLVRVLAKGGLDAEITYAPPIFPAAGQRRRSLARAAALAIETALDALPDVSLEPVLPPPLAGDSGSLRGHAVFD